MKNKYENKVNRKTTGFERIARPPYHGIQKSGLNFKNSSGVRSGSGR